jgi:hypothetical protein
VKHKKGLFFALCCAGALSIWATWRIAPPAQSSGPPPVVAKPLRGFTYQNEHIESAPWSIHVGKLDLSNKDYELHTTLAHDTIFGLNSISEQMKAFPLEHGHPIAAINGDFYRNERSPYQGDPKGLQIMNGELVSAPCDWSCFWIDAQGNPHLTNVVALFRVVWPNRANTTIGLNEERSNDGAVLYTPRLGSSTRTTGGRELVLERDGNNPWLPIKAGETYSARIRQVRSAGDSPLTRDTLVLSIGPGLFARVPEVAVGTTIKIEMTTSPDLKGCTTAIGGGPALVRGGKALEWHNTQVRHPRTAIGWNSHYFYIVEVDGRQHGLSVGMTFPELADYMVKLGCNEALNVDGGGSATFWLYGQVVNSPSEGHERETANGLVVVRKNKPDEAAHPYD